MAHEIGEAAARLAAAVEAKVKLGLPRRLRPQVQFRIVVRRAR